MADERMPEVVVSGALGPRLEPFPRLSCAPAARGRLETPASAPPLHLLERHLREVIFCLDGKGNLTFLNPAWTGLTGLPMEAALGRPLLEVVLPEERARVGELLRALAAHAQPSCRHELRLMGASGVVWVEMTAQASQAVGGVMGTLLDITERKHLQARLLRSERMATLGLLSSGIAHEMNNPLSYIIANVDFLLAMMEPGTPAPEQLIEWREVLTEVREGTERVRQAVRRLKILSRAEERGTGPMDLHRVLDMAIQMADSTLRYSGARVVKAYGAERRVDGSEGWLLHLFLDLLLQVAQSLSGRRAEEGEVHLTTREDERGRVVVEVRDNGGGLAPELLSRLGDASSQPSPEGWGTALFRCRDIVRELGGEFRVDSLVGVGSTYRVILPSGDLAPSELLEPGASARL